MLIFNRSHLEVKEVVKIKTFTLRLTEEQHEKLEKDSKRYGLTKNDYLRRLIEGRKPVDDNYLKLFNELLEEIRELKIN